jgi:cytosine/creatinine deaminase
MNDPGGPTATAGGSLLLHGGAFPDGRQRDLLLVDGVVGEAADPGQVQAAADEALDLAGFLLLPAPAEPHAHYDTALTGGWVSNPGGTLEGAVDAWRAVAAQETRDGYVGRATEAALMALTNGATAIRSHVGIYPEIGLNAVEALLTVREKLRPWIDFQLVGLTVQLTTPGSEQVKDLLEEAMRMGVDVVGGCPHLDPDGETCIDTYLDLAVRDGYLVDLHVDEDIDPMQDGKIDPNLDHLTYIAEGVRRRGLQGRVTASHCVSLGTQPTAHAREVAADLADAGVAVVSNPQTNLYLQARGDHTAALRGLTAVRPLLDAGAVLAGGGDNVQDPFNAVGRGDPLETASLLVTAGHLTTAEAYHAVSAGARAAMGLPEVRLEVGRPAEILAVRAESLNQALADPTDRVVIHQGRVVSRTTVTRDRPVPTWA